MPQLRLTRGHEWADRYSTIGDAVLSEPERELYSFVNSVASLIGPGATRFLTELWLGELACMDCIPEPHSRNLRSVSLSSSVKLASRMIASQLSSPCS